MDVNASWRGDSDELSPEMGATENKLRGNDPVTQDFLGMVYIVQKEVECRDSLGKPFSISSHSLKAVLLV